MSKKYIRKSVERMSGYVPGEQPKGAKIIKLNTNENPYPPSPKVAEVLKNMDFSTLRKYPDPVAMPVRERVAELHGVHPDNVFVGNGSDEILALCTRAFVENDGAVGYFDPSYSLYPVLTDIRAVKKVPVPLKADFSWPGVACDIASLFFLTNPNAPTSLLFERQKVEKFCATFNGVVLIDEAYVDFAPESCMELATQNDNVLVMRTLSKSYSLAGIRVGYVVGSKPLIDALYKIKDSYNLDAVAQAVALAALGDVAYMQANAARIIETRRHLTEELQKLGFELCHSATNFLWAKPPSQISASDLFVRLKAEGVLIRFFAIAGIDDYVRITVGTDSECATLLAATNEILLKG